MKKTLLLVFLGLSLNAAAQSVAIRKMEMAGDKVVIHYDLDDSNPGHEYQLNLYASNSNFATALTKVSGDVGNEIKPGTDHKIVWAMRDELGPYKGRISLEVRGKMYIPFVKLTNFAINQSYKRGKTYELGMKAGNSNPIHVELYKGGQRVSGEMNHPNSGLYALSIPSSAKPGKDYRLKITDSKNGDEVIYSPVFSVKPKIPLLFKVVPVLAVGALVATMGGGGSKDSGTVTSPAIELPPAPGN